MTTVASLFRSAVLQEKWDAVLALALVLGSILFTLVLPWPLKVLVDNVLGDEDLPPKLNWLTEIPGGVIGMAACLGLAFLVFHIGQAGSDLARTYVVAGISVRMRTALGQRILDRLQSLDLVFHARERVGDMTQRVTQDAQFASEMLANVLLPGLLAFGTLVSMLAVLISLSPELAFLAFIVSIPIPFLVNFFRPRITARSYEEHQRMGDLAAATEQSMSTIQTVQAFNRERDTWVSFRARSEDVVDAVIAAKRTELALSLSTGVLQSVGTGAALVAGGYLVLDGQITVGALLVTLAYLRSTFGPIGTLAEISAAYGRAVGKGRRVVEILEQEPAVREKPGARLLPSILPGHGRALKLEKVRFAYPDRPALLNGIDLEIAAGETVGLIGATGGGKSTLTALLIRLADPISGRITIDGIDLRDLTLESLRASMALVLQDPYLLPVSAAENIRLAKPDASMEEVEAAAKAAQADAFIASLPDGYDTIFAERGATLSGGQRQRISLARAFLKDAPIMILDEPSSALDVETEAELFAAIAAGRRSRTLFIIAHRPATLRYVDRVIELRDGKLHERAAELRYERSPL